MGVEPRRWTASVIVSTDDNRARVTEGLHPLTEEIEVVEASAYDALAARVEDVEAAREALLALAESRAARVEQLEEALRGAIREASESDRCWPALEASARRALSEGQRS
jgi:hypothetical protein